MSIKIYYDDVNYRLKGSGKIKKFLEKVILAENKMPGDLNFIFTGDENLLKINRKFLEHDYYTDVISFAYNTENNIGGEIYISIDTVRRNKTVYKVPLWEEVLRVMIHGTLHLCGYLDGEMQEKFKMTELQEKYLAEFGRIA